MIYAGTVMFLRIRGYLPRSNEPRTRETAREWLSKFGPFAKVFWPFAIALGIYDILSRLFKH